MTIRRKTPISERDLVIRTATVRDAKTGYIAACSRAREVKEEPHTITFKWQAGNFIKGEAGFNIHSTCLVDKPELGLIQISAEGIYSFVRAIGPSLGNIFRDANCVDRKERFGDIRSLASIRGTGYAVGHGGIVYRLDESGWTCVDVDLPEVFDIECIDGFDAGNMTAVGLRGQLWTSDGKRWLERSSGTNAMLTSVCCAKSGLTYAAGRGGVLLAGGGDVWETVQHDVEETIWDLAWFQDYLYASTHTGVFRLEVGRGLRPVDFGEVTPATTYQLSAAPGVLWSIGSRDIVSFDGTNWTQVV